MNVRCMLFSALHMGGRVTDYAQIKPFRNDTALFANVPLSMSIDLITGYTIAWGGDQWR